MDRSKAATLASKIVMLTCLVMVTGVQAHAQSDTVAFVEGHVLNAETGAPLQNVQVVVVRHLGNGLFDFGHTLTDKGGLYTLSMVVGGPEAPTDLYIECTPTKSGKLIRYTTEFYSIVVPARVYTRDLYVRLPKGDSQCRRVPLNPPTE